MQKKNKYNLIKGEFSPEDAEKVLFDLITSKINHHTNNAFSSNIRFGTDSESHQTRIKELKNIKENIKELLEQATNKNLKLKINGEIEIELIK